MELRGVRYVRHFFLLTQAGECGLIDFSRSFKDEAWLEFHWGESKPAQGIKTARGTFSDKFLQMFSLLVPAVITQPPLEPFINYAQGGISPETSSILDFIRDANYSVSNPSLLTTFGFSPIVIPWWMHQTIRIHSHLHFFQVPIHNLRGENL